MLTSVASRCCTTNVKYKIVRNDESIDVDIHSKTSGAEHGTNMIIRRNSNSSQTEAKFKNRGFGFLRL